MKFFKKNYKIICLILLVIILIVGFYEIDKIDDRLKQLELKLLFVSPGDILTNRIIIRDLLDGMLVDKVNQYNLGKTSDCETIKMRLGEIKSSYDRLDSYADNVYSFSTKIKDLKEANKDNLGSVERWDYIEFCLNQPVADVE